MLPCRADWNLSMHSTCNGTAAEARVWYNFCVVFIISTHFYSILRRVLCECGIVVCGTTAPTIILSFPDCRTPVHAWRISSNRLLCRTHNCGNFVLPRAKQQQYKWGFPCASRRCVMNGVHGHFNARFAVETVEQRKFIGFQSHSYISWRSCPTQDATSPMQTTISIEIYNICIWIVDYCGLKRSDRVLSGDK